MSRVPFLNQEIFLPLVLTPEFVVKSHKNGSQVDDFSPWRDSDEASAIWTLVLSYPMDGCASICNIILLLTFYLIEHLLFGEIILV
jgi:hypothetical protein